MKILVTGMRAPAGVHVSQALPGHSVDRADCIRFPLVEAKQFPSPQYAFAAFQDWLARYIQKENPDWIVPTCEDVIHTAQALEDIGEEERLFGPSSKMVLGCHDKLSFVSLCEAWGLPVPKTYEYKAGLRINPSDYVFKPRNSRFASDVYIRPDFLPDCDAGWIAQRACAGIEMCVYAIGYEGRLLGYQAYRPVIRAGKGAGIGLRPVNVSGLRKYLSVFMEKSGWTGQVSFDFFYHKGEISFIECNPRTTSGVHWFGDIGPALLGQDIVPDRFGMMQVKAAMPFFGKRGKRYDVLSKASDVSMCKVPLSRQVMTMGELVFRGRLKGLTVLESATWGIANH